MLLEQTTNWTTVQAYVTHPPSRLQLVLARAQWLWLEWQAGAGERREKRALARLQNAQLPAYLRRDIGLM